MNGGGLPVLDLFMIKKFGIKPLQMMNRQSKRYSAIDNNFKAAD